MCFAETKFCGPSDFVGPILIDQLGNVCIDVASHFHGTVHDGKSFAVV